MNISVSTCIVRKASNKMCRCGHGKKFSQGNGGIRDRINGSTKAGVARNIQGNENNGNRNRYGILQTLMFTPFALCLTPLAGESQTQIRTGPRWWQARYVREW